MHHPGVAGGCDPEWKRAVLTSDRRRRVRGVNSVQDPRQELDIGEDLPVLAQRVLIECPAVDVVEGRLRRHALGNPTQVPNIGSRVEPGGDPIQLGQIELQERGEFFHVWQLPFHRSPHGRHQIRSGGRHP